MKKIILLFTILMTGTSVFAQKNNVERELDKRSKIKIENTVYKYDRTLEILQDSTNDEARWVMKRREHSNLELATDRSTFFRSVFTAERIKELKGNRVYIKLLLDDKGNILEFKFFLYKALDITINDLHTLAKALNENETLQDTPRHGSRGRRRDLGPPSRLRRTMTGLTRDALSLSPGQCVIL